MKTVAKTRSHTRFSAYPKSQNSFHTVWVGTSLIAAAAQSDRFRQANIRRLGLNPATFSYQTEARRSSVLLPKDRRRADSEEGWWIIPRL